MQHGAARAVGCRAAASWARLKRRHAGGGGQGWIVSLVPRTRADGSHDPAGHRGVGSVGHLNRQDQAVASRQNPTLRQSQEGLLTQRDDLKQRPGDSV